MTDKPRLIEFAFPLRVTSLDSMREKYGPRGHISGFHLWPARRPLAASRACLIATLLPDPGSPEKRVELCEKIGGRVIKRIEKKKMPGGQVVDREKEETEGGILQWGREIENAETVDWFRSEIRKAFGGRAPKVLDPFAGGGAIPFEAMRLGCEATAIDINPVAWFILKCTLEYPQRLAGQKRPLPAFILQNHDFMTAFFKAQGLSKAQIRTRLEKLGVALRDQQGAFDFETNKEVDVDADLAWHVRAWAQWVLDAARKELAAYYPVYADFEPLEKDKKSYERQPMRIEKLRDDGTADIDALNSEFSEDYLAVKANPRWVAKPTVAYLWTRTVTCKNCRATIPLLKTRWLCKKDRKRVLLTMEPTPDKSGVVFGIDSNVPAKGGNAAQRREHDKKVAAGTMSRAGAKCPCCPAIMTMEDIRVEGKAGRLDTMPTAVVVDGPAGKEYRLSTEKERNAPSLLAQKIGAIFSEIPHGLPDEPTPSEHALGMRIPKYGFRRWCDLYTPRQLAAIGSLLVAIRRTDSIADFASMDETWREALRAYLAASLDRLVDQATSLCTWYLPGENVKHTYVRYALPIVWDFAESNPLFEGGGSWLGAVRMCCAALDHALLAAYDRPVPIVKQGSATSIALEGSFDLVVTDPPYYDAIPYSDLMDLFYVWLRRAMGDAGDVFRSLSEHPLSPKWDHASNDGELIDDNSRHDGNKATSRRVYEDGMFRAFLRCNEVLRDSGRMVVVFAHKDPLAWETLAAALIRSGFVVDASWPIQTENATRSRARSSAALASSLWLVCKKRPETARPGWDNKVLDDMRVNIGQRLREFWDAGIRGPDFVWAATGPALETYSKHPVVKMANDPGQTLTVTEFLNHARRMVVDFVVGRVLGSDSDEADITTADRLDETTAYYLLHRNDFGLDEAPVGACILYATACGLSDHELASDWDILAKTGGDDAASVDEELEEIVNDEQSAEETGGGSKVKLKAWNQRRGHSMGLEAPGGRPVPLVDRIHRLMHLWKAGDVHKIDEFLDEHGLRRHELFGRVLQSLIELAKHASEERSLLESLSNHIGAKGAKKREPQKALVYSDDE